MIGMAAGQVLLRNFFDGGVWGDSAVQVMVLGDDVGRHGGVPRR